MLIGLTMFPALLTNGDPPPLAVCGIAAGPMEVILATIRTLESGGDYTAEAHGASASGAYQFVDGTWNGYGGYNHAAVSAARGTGHEGHRDRQRDPRPERRRRERRPRRLVYRPPPRCGLGRVGRSSSARCRQCPHTEGVPNTMAPEVRRTPRHCTGRRWITASDRSRPGSCFGGFVDPIVDGWSLPTRALIDANPEVLTYPHHDYPAWDWMIPVNTPIYAVRAGRVATIRTWPHNWWTESSASTAPAANPAVSASPSSTGRARGGRTATAPT